MKPGVAAGAALEAYGGAYRPRVLVREPIAEAGIELLRERFEVDVDSEGDLAERIGDYDALIVRSGTKVTRELIERAGRLKVIGRAGVGVDNVDVDAATERGIIVANAPQSTVISAAEHTIGLLLALSRNIPQAHAALRRDGGALALRRPRAGGQDARPRRLRPDRPEVARRAAGLEMRVLAYDPHAAPDRFRSSVPTAVEPGRAPRRGRLRFAPPDPDARDPRPDGAEQPPREAGVRVVNGSGGELVDEEALAGAPRAGTSPAPRSTSSPRSRIPAAARARLVVTPRRGGLDAEAQHRAGIVWPAGRGCPRSGVVERGATRPRRREDFEVLGAVPAAAGELAALAFEWPAATRAARPELLGLLAERTHASS